MDRPRHLVFQSFVDKPLRREPSEPAKTLRRDLGGEMPRTRLRPCVAGVQVALVFYAHVGRGEALSELCLDAGAARLAGIGGAASFAGIAQRRITATMANRLPSAARP